MKIRMLIGAFLCWCLPLAAQTPSGVTYPLADCIGATCPGVTTVKSHITCVFTDSLTETVYVGGQFRRLGGQTRIGIGAMDGASGALLPFAPVIDTFGCIYAMGMKGDTLFVGGRFTTVNGIPRSNFAAIRISTGALLPAFNTGIGGTGDTVFAISVYNGRIYVGGKFTTVFAQGRTNIARLNYDGTVNVWNPTGVGIIRKTMQSGNRIVVIEDVGTADSRVAKYDTASAAVTALLTTTNSFSGNQDFQDFIIRNDSVYATGNFYEVETVPYDGFVVACISNGNNRSWGISIPLFNISERNKVKIEYYRDSVYIQVFDGLTQVQPYHSLYVAYYRSNTLRTMKVYNSNAAGLNGWYGQDIAISNARLFEVERFAQHTAFPNGSNSCSLFSWCLKIPALCGNLVSFPVNVCPGDTFWIVVQHLSYYASYNWTTFSPNITLYPDFDSCMVVTTAAYTGSNVRVQGVTSCGIMNSGVRAANTNDWPLPSVSAGADDSVSCVISGVTLYGNASTTFPPLTWNWNGPSGFSVADSMIVSAPGMYYATVTDANGCSETDSAFVFADTVPPIIVPYGPTPVITCANPVVTLDASSVYPLDSLRWIIGASSFSNPATTALPGNVLLAVTDRRNGCSSEDTLLITQNTTPPAATAVYTDSILTCAMDSILLSGNSANPDVIFTWTDSAATVFSDPFWVTTPGYYFLNALDTTNGCTSSPDNVLVYTWHTPPHVSTVTDTLNINCSYDSVLLDGMSLTASATLFWTGPTPFGAADPAMTGAQGMYVLTATDSLNGCTTTDTAYVGYQPVLDVTGVNDTVICPGSGAVLNIIPIGGTFPFTYQWNNSAGNTALVTVYPPDTLQYIVTVNDNNGCVGEDTVIVHVPDPMLDSTVSFQPCDPLQPTGQIQVYPLGGVPPYQFSIDNGLSWQTSGVFGGLTYGTYQFLIQDAIGCSHSTSANIDTNSLSPAPEFLVSTSPEMGDTIVIVDISNPRPDSVLWDFPAGTAIVDTSMFSPGIIPADTGAFTISMHAFYGSCEVILTRLIQVQPLDSLNADPWNNNAIDSLILYPNPNSGIFTVHTELEGAQDFVVLVIDELGNERARQQVYDADNWTGQMSVSNPVPGNYILRVIAEFDSAETVFVIAQ